MINIDNLTLPELVELLHEVTKEIESRVMEMTC